MKIGSCTSYDLDEPEEAEAVLLEGCEHAEDLTEAVKSSACSPFRSTASARSSDRSRSIRIRRAHEDARLRSWRHPLVGRCRTNGVAGWAGDHPVTPMDIFLGRLVKCTIDKFINITHSGKTESKDCSQFSLTMSWSDIYKFIDENKGRALPTIWMSRRKRKLYSWKGVSMLKI